MADLNHIYVVPAYGHSPHLADCLASLAAQSTRSRIVVSTSTPFEGMEAMVQGYGASLFVHGPNRGIGVDWNAALCQGEGRLVTLAHQDDLYHPDHTAEVSAAFAKHPDAILAFSAYQEVMNGAPRPANLLMWVKRIQIELGFLGTGHVASAFSKKRLLMFGNPIACPAVTLDFRKVPDFRFNTEMRTNMDWEGWLSLARRPGGFVHVRKALVSHRIHPGSETTACIADGYRAREDYAMFRAMWPAWAASLLAKMYSVSYASNREPS
ncbi:glycosyltransferase family A protein [Pyxidicoccus sp. 3LG]